MQRFSNLATRILSSKDMQFIKSIKVFLFDCDGVIWKGSQAIPGSVETINLLKKLGRSVFYVTNNSTKSRQETLNKLQGMGIQSSLNEVITSSYATAQYLKTCPDHGKVYVVGEDGIYDELNAVGIPCCGREDNDASDISVLTSMDSEVRTVAVGLDRQINYVKISRAASYIRDYGCRYIATNTDGSFPNAGGIISGGSGCMVSAISTVSGKNPDCIIGKPNHFFIDLALQQCPGTDLNDILMVGDRLDTDIAFANANKIHSLCVLSGISTEEMVKNADTMKVPTLYTHSLQDIQPFLKSS